MHGQENENQVKTMKTTIYFFTGTGNTLAVARDLARELERELGDTELVPIPSLIRQDEIVADVDAVGIAFPVYFLDMPGIVKEFIQKLRFTGKPYIFGIATCGERPGGALFNLKSLLLEKGAALAAGFAFVMPENFIGPVDLMGDAGHRQEKYAGARKRVPEVAAAIRQRTVSPPEGSSSALPWFMGFMARTMMTSVYNTPGRFRATKKCNRCRTCERICPTKNISVRTDAVRWGKRCTQCYACIHWCPKEAIEIGGRTQGKRRYHHPDVTLDDMLHQRGGA
jgi:ferredoxin/flavodoxin